MRGLPAGGVADRSFIFREAPSPKRKDAKGRDGSQRLSKTFCPRTFTLPRAFAFGLKPEPWERGRSSAVLSLNMTFSCVHVFQAILKTTNVHSCSLTRRRAIRWRWNATAEARFSTSNA